MIKDTMMQIQLRKNPQIYELVTVGEPQFFSCQKATYFKAKNIVFENSFNRYMTTEEINEGVEILGDASASPINIKRVSSLDVKSKAATERDVALSANAAYSEFLN